MPTPEEITRHGADQPPPGLSPLVRGASASLSVGIVEYDARWPTSYALLEERVRRALGWRVLQLDHVGSTSVPGLPAKPVIDINLVLADPTDEASYIPALGDERFVLRIREPWWYEHRMLRHDDPPANLHVFGPQAPEPIRMRLFRDWLRAHPEDRERYAAAKVIAATSANAAAEHVMQYNARKESVIREIYDRTFRAAGLLPS